MTDQPKAPGKPAAVKTLNGWPLPGKPAICAPHAPLPRSIRGVNGGERPAALPMPAERNISALARPCILDKWATDAAGIRAVESGDNVVTMFGTIGEDYWSGGGITAKSVTAQLRAIGDRPIEVQINSPGGDMFEGIAIYNVLREHAQHVTIKIMGMAASAASVIAMAGDTIEIGAVSFLMIHNCWVIAVGNRHDMAETSTYLAPFDQAMADVYAFRSGATAAECAKWMDAETYMSGSVAIERGFADRLLGADQTTRDEKVKAFDRERTAITALELKLVAGGDTRAQAREHITKIKGTPGAVQDDVDTPGAVTPDYVGAFADLRQEAIQVSPWVEAAFVKYGWIWIGLSFGFMAKYALLIKRGVPVQARIIIADVLLLPAVALIAYWGVTKAGLAGETAALTACFCCVGADRLMKLMTERFFAQVQAMTLRDVAQDVIASRGDLRNTVQTARSARHLTEDPDS